MTTMVTEVYDAFVSAGADDAKARRAAEVLTDYDTRFDKLERRIDAAETSLNRRIDAGEANLNRRIDAVEANLNRRIDAVEGNLSSRLDKIVAEQAMMRWMMGTLLALMLTVFVKSFVH